ncbi:MAG: tyrosine-type recombinase/integrase [Pirellulales bacterium]
MVPTLPAPPLVQKAGAAARFAFDEFFAGRIRNKHTRAAYLHAVQKFLGWCEERGLDLIAVTPGLIGHYLDEHPGSPPTKKLHMSAIRGFFDLLVVRHVVVLNPALSAKTERYSALDGKTPEITVEQARRLLQSIPRRLPVDYRDRAIIALLIYTAARAGAVAALRLGDLVDEGTQRSLRFREKGGKQRAIPVRHDLEQLLLEYLSSSTTAAKRKESPLFRTSQGRSGTLGDRPLTGADICRMVKRRIRVAGLPSGISPHSFRACTATDLLLQGVPLEDVQHLLGHADARVTRLYDRRQKRVTRNIVERISV